MIAELIVKTLPLLGFAYFTFYKALLIAAVYILFRKTVIALVCGLQEMDSMDAVTFQTNAQSPANVISLSFLKTTKEEAQNAMLLAKRTWLPVISKHPKMRSSIVKVFGEMYYKLEDKSIDQLVSERVILMKAGEISTR
jgi:hypothetical protein